MKRLLSPAFSVILFAICWLPLPLASQRCGVERWSVKTGTDPDANKVDLVNLKNSSIAEMTAIPKPDPTAIPPKNRMAPTRDGFRSERDSQRV
jgi:hypothetical protein